MKKRLVIGMLSMVCFVAQAAVTISNLNVAQREGSKLVDIHFSVSNDLTNTVEISVLVSNGVTAVDASSLIGDVGFGITTGTMKHITWNAGIDWNTNGH